MGEQVKFEAIRYVNVTYFFSAYPPQFYRPISGVIIPEKSK